MHRLWCAVGPTVSKFMLGNNIRTFVARLPPLLPIFCYTPSIHNYAVDSKCHEIPCKNKVVTAVTVLFQFYITGR